MRTLIANCANEAAEAVSIATPTTQLRISLEKIMMVSSF